MKSILACCAVGFVLGVVCAGCNRPAPGEEDALQRKGRSKPMAQATFAAGCFWGVEDAFRRVDGVVDTEVGYTGGHTENPTYKEVCTGTTGHAEAVRLEYDPEQISYEELLDIFWEIHNPTTANRQGPDVGAQYRSVIFYHTEDQKRKAEEAVRRLDRSDAYDDPVVTRIESAQEFYRAEEYHQCYLAKQRGEI